MAAGTQALVTILAALCGGGGLGVAYSFWRGRKMQPREQDDLVSRAAQQAIDAMDTVLKAAVDERRDLMRKVELLESRDREKGKRIAQLEEQVRTLTRERDARPSVG